MAELKGPITIIKMNIQIIEGIIFKMVITEDTSLSWKKFERIIENTSAVVKAPVNPKDTLVKVAKKWGRNLPEITK